MKIKDIESINLAISYHLNAIKQPSCIEQPQTTIKRISGLGIFNTIHRRQSFISESII
jgi:hypothetical protein